MPQRQTIQQPEPQTQTQQPAFPGFNRFVLPYTYAPNQFFDILLKHVKDRGVVRIVSHMLYRQRRTMDADGHAVDAGQSHFTYDHLIKHAGVARGSIKPAISKSIQLGFIRQNSKPVRPGKGQKAAPGTYSINWDFSDQYATSLDAFQGFSPFKEHGVWIPNEFFTAVIPHEKLSTSAVVGAVIRNTIGWKDDQGFRRMDVQMPFTQLQKQMLLSLRAVAAGISQALQAGYVVQVNQGIFDPLAGKMSEATTYSLKWKDYNLWLFPETAGSRIQKEIERIKFQLLDTAQNEQPQPSNNGYSTGVVQSVHRRVVQSVHRDAPQELDQSVHRIGSKRASDRFKTCTRLKSTSKKTTHKKQQQGASAPAAVVVDHENHQFSELKSLLQQEGVHHRTAARLIRDYPHEQIQSQLNWLKKREARKNPAGLLIRAIEENWDEPGTQAPPTTETSQSPGKAFASHFYAGYHGNQDAPTAQPSSNDVASAEQYVKRLLALWPDESQIASWGRAFGEYTRSKQRSDDKAIVSFVIALRSYGDAFYTQHKARREEAQRRAEDEAEAAHLKEFEPKYFAYLREIEERIKTEQPDDYAEFEKDRDERRAEIGKAPWRIDREGSLERFDREETRLEDFQEYFSEEVLDFWDWGEQRNPDSLRRTKCLSINNLTS